MQELLTVLVTWLSFTLGLQGDHPQPDIRRADAEEMRSLRLERAEGQFPRHLDIDACEACGEDVFAMYDDQTRTIYLPREWTGATPAETSILVHELVHHLQNVAELPYDCAAAREKPAYLAQQRWLELFGTSLSEEFQLDPMTLLVRTSCLH